MPRPGVAPAPRWCLVLSSLLGDSGSESECLGPGRTCPAATSSRCGLGEEEADPHDDAGRRRIAARASERAGGRATGPTGGPTGGPDGPTDGPTAGPIAAAPGKPSTPAGEAASRAAGYATAAGSATASAAGSSSRTTEEVLPNGAGAKVQRGVSPGFWLGLAYSAL